MKKSFLLSLSIVAVLMACEKKESPKESAGAKFFAVSQQSFGQLSTGEEATLYTLKSPTGMQIGVTNYGAIITSWLAPNQDGVYEDVVLGFESVDGYEKFPSYFGAVVGRYGNRIEKGKFELDGETYELAINNSPNNLHGGTVGFDKVFWQAKEFVTDSTSGIVLTYVSEDGEEGFPGTLTSTVTYTLDGSDALTIDYLATTDKATHVNLTQHSYFNLSGDVSRSILDHKLMIASNEITPVDKDLIPTGVMMPVEGTPFDFTAPTVISKGINDEHEQIKFGLGYDHNWVLDPAAFDENGMALASVLVDTVTGRKMEVLTTEPGIQFYSGNFMNDKTIGKGGKVYDYRYGLCLETQHYPDTPNKPQFPTTLLKPGEEYRTTTIYRFSSL